MGKRFNWTPEIDRKIIELSNQGKTPMQVAKLMKCGLSRHHISRRKRQLLELDGLIQRLRPPAELLIRLDGMGVASVASQIGIPAPLVRRSQTFRYVLCDS